MFVVEKNKNKNLKSAGDLEPIDKYLKACINFNFLIISRVAQLNANWLKMEKNHIKNVVSFKLNFWG